MIRNWFLLNLKMIFNVHIEYNRYSKIQKIGPNLVKFASFFPVHLLQEKLRITNDCYLISSCFSAICDSSNSYTCFLIKKRMWRNHFGCSLKPMRQCMNRKNNDRPRNYCINDKLTCQKYWFTVECLYNDQRRIQNPVKHRRWRFLEK